MTAAEIKEIAEYQIIYADPPWHCWVGGNRNASKHYNCMGIEDIYAMPVAKIAAKNCALFLWATFPMLPECIETLRRWGFRYSTVAFTWIKRNPKSDAMFMGCGNYTRANAEICLLGIRGSMKRKDKTVRQIIYASRGRHSSKPTETRDRIIQLFGDLPRVELFARYKVPGWDAWGNEVKSDIEML